MEVRVSIPIMVEELIRLQIPSRITEAQLRDSGYTYRFTEHKQVARELIQQMLTENIEYDFRFMSNGRGVELIASVNIEEKK